MKREDIRAASITGTVILVAVLAAYTSAWLVLICSLAGLAAAAMVQGFFSSAENDELRAQNAELRRQHRMLVPIDHFEQLSFEKEVARRGL